MDVTKSREAIDGVIQRIEKYPDNDLPTEELRKLMKASNCGWSNDTESWPPDEE